MVLTRYFLGGVIERTFNVKLEDHIEKVVIVVGALSLLPPLIEFLKHRSGKKAAAGDGGEVRHTDDRTIDS